MEFEDYIGIIKHVFIESKSVEEVSNMLNLESKRVWRFVDSVFNIDLSDDEDEEVVMAQMVFGDLLFVTTENLIDEGQDIDSIVKLYMRIFDLTENTVKTVMLYD